MRRASNMKFLYSYLCVIVTLAVPSIAAPNTKHDIFTTNKSRNDLDFKTSLDQLTTLLERLDPAKKCDLCKVLTFGTQQGFVLGEDDIAKFVVALCEDLHVEDSDICVGIIKVFRSEVLTVFDSLALRPSELCGILLGDSCGKVYNPWAMWNVTLPPKRQGRRRGDYTGGRRRKTVEYRSESTARVLQLSDIHIDQHYRVGAEVDCDRPVCCQNVSRDVKVPAGRWGSYGKCDSPPWLVEQLFKHLANNEQFDYIIWTGDLTSHADWSQTRAGVVSLVRYLSGLFVKYFPGVPVYPSLGNHESVPVNGFPPPFVTGSDSISWLYTHLVDAWKPWLANDTTDDILRGGYYTAVVRPGFRIVSLNMNYCNNKNWWLLLNTTDPASELSWLVTVLYQAEKTGERVHILGHIAPGLNDCLKAWSWNYYRIIDRFAATVTAQFFGHTHTDSLQLFYDPLTLTTPVSVAYLGPSVTTYTEMNPGYRVYSVESLLPGSQWSVLDHETFILNLTEANTQDNPAWQREYSAKATYNLPGLTPADWHQFSERLLHENRTIEMYHRFFTKSCGRDTQCDATCARHHVCDMRTGRSHDPQLCANLTLDWREHMLWQQSNSYC